MLPPWVRGLLVLLIVRFRLPEDLHRAIHVTDFARRAHVAECAVDVFGWTITDLLPWLDELLALLTPSDLKQGQRFRNPQRAKRFALDRAAARVILSEQLDVEPLAIQLVPTASGKPGLSGFAGRCEFNMSRSAEATVFAMSQAYPVGIDIEGDRPLPEASLVAEEFLSGTRLRRFRSLPAAARTGYVLREWTRMEAALKAVGCGLTIPLKRFGVCDAGPMAIATVDGYPGRILIRDLPGFVQSALVAVATYEAPS